jgi:hypothetical protein
MGEKAYMETDKGFKFELGAAVVIGISGERGVVIGRAVFSYCECSYLIRYIDATGHAIESWWTESALKLAD